MQPLACITMQLLRLIEKTVPFHPSYSLMICGSFQLYSVVMGLTDDYSCSLQLVTKTIFPTLLSFVNRMTKKMLLLI